MVRFKDFPLIQPLIFIAGRPGAALLFWFFGDFRCGALLFMVIHVVCGYKGGWKWLLSVGLACGHLFGKLLFTWLSLVMSMMVSFVLSFFPRDVLDEILNLIESVSEDFPSYSLIKLLTVLISQRR